MQIQFLADYILQNFSRDNGGITHLKLQKLLFYVKAWSLVAGQPVLPAPFLKWSYGPVNPEIWEKFKHFKADVIEIPMDLVQVQDAGEKQLIDFIVENYADFHPLALSAMTHSEAPWKNTPRHSTIPEETIKSYYSAQLFAKNFPLDENKPFYPVISDMDSAFILDMSPQDALKSMVFPSYKEYKRVKEQARKSFEENKKHWLKKLA